MSYGLIGRATGVSGGGFQRLKGEVKPTLSEWNPWSRTVVPWPTKDRWSKVIILSQIKWILDGSCFKELSPVISWKALPEWTITEHPKFMASKEAVRAVFTKRINFETLFIFEIMKAWLNKSLIPPLYFWHDSAGIEVELFVEEVPTFWVYDSKLAHLPI